MNIFILTSMFKAYFYFIPVFIYTFIKVKSK